MPNRLDLFTDWLSSYCIRHISLNLTLKCIIWLYNIIQIMKMIVVLQALIAVCWAQGCSHVQKAEPRHLADSLLAKNKIAWHSDFWSCISLKRKKKLAFWFLMLLLLERVSDVPFSRKGMSEINWILLIF